MLKVYYFLSALPVLLFGVLLLEAKTKHWEGWSALTLGAAVEPVLQLSFLLAILGFVLIIKAAKQGKNINGLLAAFIIAALPVLFFLWGELFL